MTKEEIEAELVALGQEIQVLEKHVMDAHARDPNWCEEKCLWFSKLKNKNLRWWKLMDRLQSPIRPERNDF